MIYGESTASYAKLIEALRKLGLYEANAKILPEYLDIGRERDDSLLEKAKLTTFYRRDYTVYAAKNDYSKAVLSEIVREKNDELTRRFICFLWASFGANCFEYMEKLVVSPTEDSLKKLLKDSLLPWLGEALAEKCAHASMCVYSLKRIYDGDRTLEEMAEAADLIMPVNKSTALLIYAFVLERSPLPENGAEAGETVKRICRIIEDQVNDPAPQNGHDTDDLALGEGAVYSEELKERFRKRAVGRTGSIAFFAANHKCLRMLDVIDNEPDLCDKDYIRVLMDLKDGCGAVHAERMAKEHTKRFTSAMMSHPDLHGAKKMSAVLEELGLPCPDLGEVFRLRLLGMVKKLNSSFSEKVLDFAAGKVPVGEVVDELLEMKKGSGSVPNETFDYYGVMGADELLARVYTIIMLNVYGYSRSWVTERMTGLAYQKHESEVVKLMFSAGLPANALLAGVGEFVDHLYSDKDGCLARTASAAAEHPDKLEGLDAGKLSNIARQIAVIALGKHAERFKQELLAMADDGSKAVRNELAKIMAERRDWNAEISELLFAKKAAKRELAIAVIERQGADSYREALEKAFEAEKSAKIKDKIAVLLGSAVSSAEGGATLSVFDAVEELTKGGKAKKVAWAFEGSVKPVRKADGGDTEQKYLEAILLCYANMTNLGVSPTANTLAEPLNERELNGFAAEVFGKWLDLGAQAKTKWVLYFAAIHGGDGIIDDFMHYIKYWGENSRGAIASEAVRAMALSGSTTALMHVDGMSRKFKNKMVRAAASDALRNAAEELGLTTEELADRIVPDLGFDENMCRVFDYGSRQFSVYLGAGNEPEIYNGDKRIKSLPKPGANDDPDKAAQASADFKEMKKQLKTVAANQKARLESVLMNDRKWSVEGWRSLFVKNAVMHGFAIGLIWGLYGEDGSLAQTFRYTEEGSFNTSDDDELELPETGLIGLVHPLELTAEQLDEWKTQLEDYEIEQPFPQLARKVYLMTDKERRSGEILRFDGVELNSLSLMGKLTKLGWYKGQAEDAGWFGYFYREDISGRKKLPDGTYVAEGVLADLSFSGMSIVVYDFEGEDVTVGKLELYRPGANLYRDKPMQIGEVSDRYFSELIMQLSSVLGDGSEG